MNLGFWEILLIALVVLVFFGPSRLPGLGRSIGAAIKGLKQGLKDGEVETEAEELARYRESAKQQKLEQTKPETTASYASRPKERENSPTL